MTKSDVQVNFRMPSALKVRLQEAASDNGRSMGAEVVHRLEKSFADDVSDVRELMHRLDEIMAQLDDMHRKSAAADDDRG